MKLVWQKLACSLRRWKIHIPRTKNNISIQKTYSNYNFLCWRSHFKNPCFGFRQVSKPSKSKSNHSASGFVVFVRSETWRNPRPRFWNSTLSTPFFLHLMVGEMVQNSQTLYSFTFTAVIVVHEYIYSHLTTKFTFKKYICLQLTTYFLFTIEYIFTHIYGMYHSHSTALVLSVRTFTIQIFIQHGTIFIQPFNMFCALPLWIFRSQLPLFSERKWQTKEGP